MADNSIGIAYLCSSEHILCWHTSWSSGIHMESIAEHMDLENSSKSL